MPPQQNGAPAPLSAPRSCSLDLTQSRKRAGISLEQIAERTKISLRFLRAIEAEEFEKLPGGIFTTSYLRQYAAAIGYGESKLLAHYDGIIQPGGDAAAVLPQEKRGFFD